MIKFEPHPEIAIPVKGKGYNPSNYGEGYRAVYKYDYQAIFSSIVSGRLKPIPTYRQLIRDDLFFVTFFVMENPLVNTPFGVRMNQVVQDGPVSDTLDVWARGHLKSWTLTQGETVQLILTDPEKTHVIFSYKKPKAEDFLAAIKRTLEKPFLVQCFPDILYENPDRESPSWSIQNGILVKRQAQSRKEKTVEAYGVLEGMPTGGHWDRTVYDDIETADLAKNPDQLEVLIEMYEYSKNLRAPGARTRNIGTYYSHCGLLVYLREKKKITGEPMYHTRIVPATGDGTKSGNPVFLSQEELDELKTDKTFNSQQLCNPTPDMDIKLDYSLLRPIEPRLMPKNRMKFVVVDPAGDNEQTKGARNDAWAMGCISVEPVMDDLGTSRIFIEDAVCDSMNLNVAVDAAVGIYTRNGRITGIGVERVGTDSAYEHIRKALLARGRYVKIKKSERDDGNMILLSPDGKSKIRRIESALSWPWNNGKIFYSTHLAPAILDKAKEECNKFPYFHVDFLDMLAYVYTILEKMKLTFQSAYDDVNEDEEDMENAPNVAQGRSTATGY